MNKRINPRVIILFCIIFLIALCAVNSICFFRVNLKESYSLLDEPPHYFWPIYAIDAVSFAGTLFIMRKNLQNKVVRGIVTYLMICAMFSCVVALGFWVSCLFVL